MNVHDKRPDWLPQSITQAQYDEYIRLRQQTVQVLGFDPHMVVLNGVRTLAEGEVEVEFVVPADDWDGLRPIPAQVDEWREGEVRKGRVTLRIEEATK